MLMKSPSPRDAASGHLAPLTPTRSSSGTWVDTAIILLSAFCCLATGILIGQTIEAAKHASLP